MAAPSKADWGKIHAKAWKDPKFRKLLETDPTKAVKQYGAEAGKTFDKIVKVAPKPKGVSDDKLHKHDQAAVPPACC
jgi:hypothetical protein